MKIAILGFGREGKSLLKYLKRHPRYRGSKIDVLDQKQGPDYLKKLAGFDLVFRSPGIPYNFPEIRRAAKRGVVFSSATKLFFETCPAKIIGITGTKGKGTAATLLYKILKSAGFDVSLAGNIGKPALNILPKIKKNSLVILELSSFQLQDLEKSPPIAVVLDIFPDHMDVHKNMKEYLDAKANICRHQNSSTDAVFYFKNNLLSRVIAGRGLGKKVAVQAPDDLSKNKIMAAAVAAYLGCPNEKIFKTLKSFRGLEHRLEFVTEKRGIRFYNDSAGTNPQTAGMAVLSLSKNPVVLICGGKDKNLDYSPLAEAIKKSGNVKSVILIGENKDKILRSLKIEKFPPAGRRVKLKIELAANLESAVNKAYKRAVIEGAAILFSPAAASFDMFKDYADRGKQFKNIVKGLK